MNATPPSNVGPSCVVHHAWSIMQSYCFADSPKGNHVWCRNAVLTFLLFHDLQSVGAVGSKVTGLKLCATTLNNMQQHATGQGCALHFLVAHSALNFCSWVTRKSYFLHNIYATHRGHPGFYRFRAQGSLQFFFEHGLARVCQLTQHVTSNNVRSYWLTMLCLFAQGLTFPQVYMYLSLTCLNKFLSFHFQQKSTCTCTVLLL